MKPKYRTSNITHYFSCPKSFKLAHDGIEPLISKQTLDLMNEGNVIEYYALGDTSGDIDALLKGRKQPTIDKWKAFADMIKPTFVEGEAQVKIEIESDLWIYTGTIDWLGKIQYGKDKELECISDLKMTGDIPRVWDPKNSKESFMQAVAYTYGIYKKLNTILPFIYVIVETKNYDYPITRKIRLDFTEADFEWFEKQVDYIHNDPFYSHECSRENCLGFGEQKGRCWFLYNCKEGKDLVGGYHDFKFSELA